MIKLFLFYFLLSHPAMADLAIDKTRVIVNDENDMGYFNVRNTGTASVLVQSWASDYSDNPDTHYADVAVVPPVFRLAPGEIKSVRVTSFIKVNSGEEKLLLINLQQIPTIDRNNGRNNISLSLRMRFKLFLRGKGMTSDMQNRTARLSCAASYSDNGSLIKCLNSSEYHFVAGGIEDIQSRRQLQFDNGLIKPLTSTVFKLPVRITSGSSLQLIDDNGQIFVYPLR